VRVDDVVAVPSPAAAYAGRLRGARAPGAVEPEVEAAVREIVERVSRHGDRAVNDLTAELDTGGAQPWPLRVDALELEQALDELPAPLREALELAAANVRAVALAQVGGDRELELGDGQRVELREVAVRRAAVYIPGGQAPYPSTALMGAVAAQVAGVDEVVMCAPPRAGGDAHREILAVCALCGVREVYRMGGAQAVAALALGTESISAVDVVVGPGNVYVQEAKRQLVHVIGIDSFAGPSELMVILDDTANPRLVALDLLAQAEHGPASPLLAVSPSPGALADLAGQLSDLGAANAAAERCHLLAVDDFDQALALADAFAPEHLQLVGPGAEALAAQVRCAGAVFVGEASGTAFGDYVAGSNHVLPTGGAARFASVLSPHTFRRRVAQVTLPASPQRLAAAGALIARAEGFVAHAESMQARIGDNGGHGDG
jgi:histidinol dehydrogenase